MAPKTVTVRLDWVVEVTDSTALREAAFHDVLGTLAGNPFAAQASDQIASDDQTAVLQLATQRLLKGEFPGISPKQVTLAPES